MEVEAVSHLLKCSKALNEIPASQFAIAYHLTHISRPNASLILLPFRSFSSSFEKNRFGFSLANPVLAGTVILFSHHSPQHGDERVKFMAEETREAWNAKIYRRSKLKFCPKPVSIYCYLPCVWEAHPIPESLMSFYDGTNILIQCNIVLLCGLIYHTRRPSLSST